MSRAALRLPAPRLLAFGLLAACSVPPPPLTVPERTGYAATSRLADVEAFVRALLPLPHGDRLQLRSLGRSHEGRPLWCVRATLPGAAAPRLRAVVIADIHAGEVEGKEAVQELLREVALGEHEDLLAACELHVVPVYNPDGNERIDRRNRAEQNGPDGVGQRANGADLDLNRDFVKAEAEETRALLALFSGVDPHLFLDLHTTNGSAHGYHLTFAPSLHPSVDPAVAAASRRLLDAAQAAMRTQGFATFDYGNFETHDWEQNGAPSSPNGVRGWFTYDWRARYGVNYFGLRNRVAVLSEAYSYSDFRTRIAATRAFVLAVLTVAVAQQPELLAACTAADARLVQGDGREAFGWDAGFAPPETLTVRRGEVDQVELPDGLGKRRVRTDRGRDEAMPVFRSFRSRRLADLPLGWAVPSPPPAVVQLLTLHGIRHELVAAPRAVTARRFAVSGKRKPRRPYQGHQELQLLGDWMPPEAMNLESGTLWIPATQPLARLAAQLLEPQSDDSLSTWNLLEAATTDRYPIARIESFR